MNFMRTHRVLTERLERDGVHVIFEPNGALVEVASKGHVIEARVQIEGVMRWKSEAREMVRSALMRRDWLHLANYERTNPLFIDARQLFEVRGEEDPFGTEP